MRNPVGSVAAINSRIDATLTYADDFSWTVHPEERTFWIAKHPCPKQYLEDIERRDLLKFSAFLRDEKEQAPRSCWNKFSNVMSFLKVNSIRGLVKKTDWPRYTEEEPEIYEQEELDTLFKACDDQERLWFEFFLMTGMREQEVMYTYWSDINLKHGDHM